MVKLIPLDDGILLDKGDFLLIGIDLDGDRSHGVIGKVVSLGMIKGIAYGLNRDSMIIKQSADLGDKVSTAFLQALVNPVGMRGTRIKQADKTASALIGCLSPFYLERRRDLCLTGLNIIDPLSIDEASFYFSPEGKGKELLKSLQSKVQSLNLASMVIR